MNEQELWNKFLSLATQDFKTYLASSSRSDYNNRSYLLLADFMNFNAFLVPEHEYNDRGWILKSIRTNEGFTEPRWDFVLNTHNKGLLDRLCKFHPEFNVIRVLYV